MKVRYDAKVDVLRLLFNDSVIEESDEVAPGVIVDYDAAGKMVGIEILDAADYVEDPANIDFQSASKLAAAV